MLALILAILKIIGIVLLVILCLIILIVAAVLFVPLRYRITGDYRDSTRDTTADAGISWLFGFFRAGALYRSGNFHYFVKILSFTLLSDEKKPVKKKRTHKQRLKPDTTGQAETFDDRDAILADRENRDQESARTDAAEQKSQKKHNTALRKVLERLRSLPEKIRLLMSRIRERKTKIGSKFASLKKMMEDPAYMRLAGNLYGRIKRILRLLKPSRADIQILYGADDPAVTGQVTALVAAAAGFFGWQDVEFTPDFEKETLTAQVFLKGKIRLIHVLVIAVQLLCDDDFRRIILHRNSGRKSRRRRRRRTGDRQSAERIAGTGRKDEYG